MEINKALFERYESLIRAEEKALKDRSIGGYREASVALLEIINELEELSLEFKTINDNLCLVVKPRKATYPTRPMRSYRFPSAVKTITEGDIGDRGSFAAWVVSKFGDASLYGVIKYTLDNHRELESDAWIESDAFGDDAEAAERWIRETVTELRGIQ